MKTEDSTATVVASPDLSSRPIHLTAEGTVTSPPDVLFPGVDWAL